MTFIETNHVELSEFEWISFDRVGLFWYVEMTSPVTAASHQSIVFASTRLKQSFAFLFSVICHSFGRASRFVVLSVEAR